MTLLGSKNAAVQNLRRLSGRRSARTDSATFVIDGPVLVDEARSAGVHVLEAFVDAEASRTVRILSARLEDDGVTVRQLQPGVLASAVDTVTPNGIAVIARYPTMALDLVVAPSAGDVANRVPLILVLAGVADPGNAGTLLRSAEAAGATGVVAEAGSVDLFGPKTVRASAGTLFHIPCATDVHPHDAIATLRSAGVTLCGTVAEGGTPYDRADLSGPVALVLGNEAHGIGPEWQKALNRWVTIPMAGRAESLNVAMAGTVLCFETARQRRLGRE